MTRSYVRFCSMPRPFGRWPQTMLLLLSDGAGWHAEELMKVGNDHDKINGDSSFGAGEAVVDRERVAAHYGVPPARRRKQM